MKKRIVVTQKDIDTPINPGNWPWTCPVALAIKRGLNKTGQDVTVGHNVIRVNDKKIAIPEKVDRFITAFDYNHPVKPFQFTIEI